MVSEGENIHKDFVSLVEQFEWQYGRREMQTNLLRKLVGMGSIKTYEVFFKNSTYLNYIH